MRKVLPKLPPFRNKPDLTPTPYHVVASIYAFPQFILAESKISHASSRTDPKGLALFLPPDASDAALGEAAWAVLRAARFVRPGDPDWNLMEIPYQETKVARTAYRQQLMDRAGVKTQRSLYTGAKYVSLWRQDGEIRLLPWARDGYDGWTGIPGEKGDLYPDTIGEEDLGRAVRRALERAVG